MARRSWLAFAAAFLGGLGLFDVVLGPLLIQLGWVSPLFGFQWLFGLGLLEGVAALLLGLGALWTTRPSAGRAGRPLAWFAVAAGGLLVAVGLAAAAPGFGLPAINDITTDPEDPPRFVAAREAPANRGREMAYPEAFAPQQRAAYPDLEPVRVSSPPRRALELAEETARSLGWEVVAVDPEAGRLEARETSTVFRFVDDVVVRVRPAPGGGSVVDVRSKSRDGRGDLGANAARIRAFVQALPR
ncbi:MAG: DUF1499 domain-containing protein [Myxococcota bacterium]|nr:DUF1499 domain-containing protein [Myxococcota bacterium]